MTLHFAKGSESTVLDEDDTRRALNDVYDSLGKRDRVIVVPPDFTRLHSRAGELTCMTNDYYEDSLVDILPALGTHAPMSTDQLDAMYPGIPASKFREHRWREDVVKVGEVPESFV